MLLAFVAIVTGRAQVLGRLSGRILDLNQAPVVNAKVDVLLVDGGSPILSTRTNIEGVFIFSGIRPDFYELTVEAPGFARHSVRQVKVDPSRETVVPAIRLEIETLRQAVEVTASPVTARTADSQVASTLTQFQVRNLPVADRQVSSLFRTQAGVATGRGSTVINGLRSTYANVTLDGINVQDNFIRSNGLDYIPSRLTIEQVAEFTVSTSNADASMGGAAHVIQATPSGSNQYHGALYWYNHNSAATANSWFRNRDRVDRPVSNQNQAGASFGGPIKKDRLLFYANYEALRLKQQTLRNRTILTPEARQGIFRYRVGSEIRQTNLASLRNFQADPTIRDLIGKLPVESNNTRLGDGLNTTGYSFNGRDNTERDAITGKLDYFLSPRHTFAATFMRNTDIIDRGDQDNTFNVVPVVQNSVRNALLSLSWRSSITPALTNELRGGFLRATVPFEVTTPFPPFLVSSNTLPFSNPANTFEPNGRGTNTYSIQNNATWVAGRHHVSFGFQGQWIRVGAYNNTGRTPIYTLGISAVNTTGLATAELPGISNADLNNANRLYTALAGIVNGYQQSFNITSRQSGFVAGASNAQNYINDLYSGFMQDNWRIRPRLTLNLGLRYDYFKPVDERDGLHLQPVLNGGNFIDTLLSNHTLDFAGNAAGHSFHGADRNNFAPNIGFAWDIFGTGRTSVRGGYSVAFVNEELFAIISSLSANSGLTTAVQETRLDARLTAPPPIPVPVFRVPRTIADNYATNVNNVGGTIDPNLRTPYVQQFNLSIQQALGGGVAEVRYVGNHGTKLYRLFDYDQVIVRENGFAEDFIRARTNGYLSQAAGRGFNPAYDASIAGSQPLTVFSQMPDGGTLTHTTVVRNLQTGEVGTLAQFYQTSRINGPVNFFPNPNAIQLRALSNYSNSTYHSLQAEFRRRTRSGFEFQGNYVFSKVLSDSAGNTTDRFEEFLDIRNAAIERSRAPFDLTHIFNANGYYELPVGHGKRMTGGKLERLVGGWAISGIMTWQSGTPFSILAPRGTLNRTARSPNNTAVTSLTKSQLEQNIVGLYVTGNGPYFINPSVIGADGRGVAPDGAPPFSGQAFYNPGPGTLGTLQRRMFSGPSFFNLDASLLKNTRIREGDSLEFRAEAFNVLNHPTFASTVAAADGANTDINSTTFGRIQTTLSSPRVLQFSLYYRF